MSAQHTPSVGWHRSAINRGLYGIQPIGTRQHRNPSIAEVLHFQTCHAAGPYSPVNCQVPPQVPVWQYVDPQERAWAIRRNAALSSATGSDAIAKATGGEA